MIAQPSYLLFSDISNSRHGASFVGEEPQSGRWKFVLEHLGGPIGELPERFEASDSECGATSDRLALLAVVRGLEALERPSRVKLVTTHRYVERGLRYGLPSWREKDYHWERFGAQIPVRNADLWKRVDIALQFHAVDCRYLQTASESDSAVQSLEMNASSPPNAAGPEVALDDDDQSVASLGRDVAVSESSPRSFQSKYHKVRYELLAKRSVFANRERLVEGPSKKAEVLWHDRIWAASSNSIAEPAIQWIPQSLQSWWHLVAGWIRWMKGRLRSSMRPRPLSSTLPQSNSNSALLGI